MTIPFETNWTSAIGDNTTTAFVLEADVFAADDVVVELETTATGARTPQTLDSDYTVSIGTGNVTVNMVTAPTTSEKIFIWRHVKHEQQAVSLTPTSGFDPNVVEQAFDRNTAQTMDLHFELLRSVRGKMGESADMVLPAVVDRANKLLGFNSIGAPIAYSSASPPIVVAANAIFDTLAAVAAADCSALNMIWVWGNSTVGKGGARWKKVGAEPSHIGKTQDAVGTWFEIAEEAIEPVAVGATGDGVADDGAIVEQTVTVAQSVGGYVLIDYMYGASTPIDIAEGTNGVIIRGTRGFSESAGSVGFRKLAGWSGDALIRVGTAAASAQTLSFTLLGCELDGNSQTGDGLQLFKCGLPWVEKCYSHHNTSGYGFRWDGCWFGRFSHNVSKYNGKTSTSAGGGYRFSHATRESSDCIQFECYANILGHRALDFDPIDLADSDIRQTDWRVYGGEYATGKFTETYDGNTMANHVAKICGDRLNFYGVKFIGGIKTVGANYESDPEDCVLIGDSGASFPTDQIYFDGACTFQYAGGSRPTANPADYSVKFAGPIGIVGFDAPIVEGIGNFIDANTLTGSPDGPVTVFCGDDDMTIIRDTNGKLQTANGAVVGWLPGAAMDQLYLRAVASGVPINIQVYDGSTRPLVKFGAGTNLTRADFTSMNPRLPPLAAEPSDLVAGLIAHADQVTWDPLALGAGGSYLVWYNGTAWRLLDAR